MPNKKILFFLLFQAFTYCSFSQIKGLPDYKKRDTGVLTSDTASGKKPATDSGKLNLLVNIEELVLRMNKYEKQLKRGFTSNQINEDLNNIIAIQNIIDSNLSSGSSIADVNLRNVSSFKVVLVQYHRKISEWNNELNGYTDLLSTELAGINQQLSQLYNNTLLSDSIVREEYLQELDNLKSRAVRFRHQQDSLSRSAVLTEKKVAQA